jgi:hypothetical protein
MGRVWAQSW